jgi:hypothetical protein
MTGWLRYNALRRCSYADQVTNLGTREMLLSVWGFIIKVTSIFGGIESYLESAEPWLQGLPWVESVLPLAVMGFQLIFVTTEEARHPTF